MCLPVVQKQESRHNVGSAVLVCALIIVIVLRPLFLLLSGAWRYYYYCCCERLPVSLRNINAGRVPTFSGVKWHKKSQKTGSFLAFSILYKESYCD